MKKRTTSLAALAVLTTLTTPLVAYAGEIPAGEALTLERIGTAVATLAAFFIRMSGIFAAIALVTIGIWMMFAKTPEQFTDARKWFVRALWGALIIFGVGVILNTIQGIFTGNFSGGFF